MLYFKNTELAQRHHITLRTVLNWIQSAKEGKLELTLHTENNKSYIANTARNQAAINRLVQERRKYRNTKTTKLITPLPKFYQVYSPTQAYDLITSLELHHEIPRQYNYFDGGATLWDKYAEKLATEDVPNVIRCTIQLVEKNQQYIDFLLENYEKVNIVDIGPGNALPAKGLLTHLLNQGKLGRYIAFDISSEMIDIAKHNIDKWFDGKVQVEKHEADINYDRFSTLLTEEYLKKDADKTANLILLLGGTLCNFREADGALRIIKNSMGSRDLMLHTQKLDSEATRRYFDFSTQPGQQAIPQIHGFVVELLNIPPELYDLDLGYDDIRHERYERIKFKVAVTMKFEFENGERVLEFHKGESILLWRSWQQTSADVTKQLSNNGFRILHASHTPDGDYMLTASKVQFE